jgi:hypothetical protein
MRDNAAVAIKGSGEGGWLIASGPKYLEVSRPHMGLLGREISNGKCC